MSEHEISLSRQYPVGREWLPDMVREISGPIAFDIRHRTSEVSGPADGENGRVRLDIDTRVSRQRIGNVVIDTGINSPRTFLREKQIAERS